jgi:hypothetical protein
MSIMRNITWGVAAAAAVAGLAGTAMAQSAAAKAAVDAAKAQGVVGEQGDGLLGFVSGGGDASLQAAVREINAGRQQLYREAAAKAGDGATAETAGARAFQTTILPNVVKPGQYYRPLNGGWTRK